MKKINEKNNEKFEKLITKACNIYNENIAKKEKKSLNNKKKQK